MSPVRHSCLFLALAAVAVGCGGPARLYLVSADGSGTPALIDRRPGLAAPCFTHDGTALLYEAGASPSRRIYRAAIDGTDPFLWLQSDEDLSGLVGGSGVYTVTGWKKGRGNRILLVDERGTLLGTIEGSSVAGISECYAPAFFPHGARLALVAKRSGGGHGIAVFDRKDGSITQVTPVTRQFDQPHIASELGEIFSIERSASGVSIVRLPGDGSAPAVVKGGIAFSDVTFDVSPDGARIVFAGMRGLVEIETGAERLLSPQGADPSYPTERDPCYSPSGEAILFISKEKGHSRLIRLKRDGTRSILASEKGTMRDICFSPDGLRIAYVVS